ncbi:DL-endopeptidase inhibitor IseA family protein [Chungangia koreensis]|uniref:DL-endopeptidase inhibitor IseA family protein n=1 Tax=Chungangia koreensis TaxID=752657 RepID=A0ABV8X7A3_9LACT
MLKKLFAMLMSFLLVVGLFMPAAVGAAPKGFKDLKDDYWAKKEIEYLVNKRIINGYDDKTFKPNKGITKAQAAVMLVKARDLKTEKDPAPIFKDVKKKDFAYKEIAAAVKAGIFEKGDKFYPNKPMTRADVALAISKGFNIKGTGNVTFKDVSKTSPAYGAISALAEHKIIMGYPDGTFKPNGKVTRVQFAVMVYRAMNADEFTNQYEIPVNMNPITIMFKYVLVNPDGAKEIFLPESNFNLKEFGKNVITFENVNFKEIARVNGLTEFVLTFDAKLEKNYKGKLVEKGNRLYVVVKKTGFMEFKISAIGTTPHLTADESVSITDQQALTLIADAKNAYWTVVRGGDDNRTLITFMYNGTEYRYMAESLSTMEKLKGYLGKYYTPAKVEDIIKKLRIISLNGKLAQPNADGGSLMDYRRAVIKPLSSVSSTIRSFELTVPLSGTGKTEKVTEELHLIAGQGWRVAEAISNQQAIDLFTASSKVYWSVVSGGEGKRVTGSFNYNGNYYRWMAESLDTMQELKEYLNSVYTPAKTDELIKQLGIVEINGKLAQPDADGGSLLNYNKASINSIKGSELKREFELIVPLGDTGLKEKTHGELQFVVGSGWRVSNLK